MSPGLAKDLSNLLVNFNSQIVLNVLDSFTDVIEYICFLIWFNKVKVRAIIDSGAPINIVSTKLINCLKLLSDIYHAKTYGTAGLSSTTLVGAITYCP